MVVDQLPVVLYPTGIMGEVYIDSIGDRIADYSLLDMSQSGMYEVRTTHS